MVELYRLLREREQWPVGRFCIGRCGWCGSDDLSPDCGICQWYATWGTPCGDTKGERGT